MIILKNVVWGIGLLFSFLAHSLTNDQVLPSPSRLDCTFYTQLESTLKCYKESPYLTAYGYPYCNKFQENGKSWTGALKKWVPETTFCLQAELIRDRTNLHPCKLMEDTAFGSHPTCYMKHGFCELSNSDRQQIMNVVAWNDVKSTFSQSVSQALRVKSTCKVTWSDAFSHLWNFFFSETRNLDEVAKTQAAEILLKTPFANKTESEQYLRIMNYVIATNDKSLDPKTTASYLGMTVKESSAVPMQASFDECKTMILENKFCRAMKASNATAYKKARTGKEFVSALPLIDIKQRIKRAHEISLRWNTLNEKRK